MRLLWSGWRHRMETFSASLAFARGIHRSPVNSPRKGQWRGVLMFSLICAWIDVWVNNREVGDVRRHWAHYDVIVMIFAEHGSNLFHLLCIGLYFEMVWHRIQPSRKTGKTWDRLNIKMSSYYNRNPIIIRRSHESLIFIKKYPYMERQSL